MAPPIFWGVQILAKDGVLFSSVPHAVRRELEAGRPSTDIALALLCHVFDAGMRTIYLIPPILRGGARQYDVAQAVLAEARRVYYTRVLDKPPSPCISTLHRQCGLHPGGVRLSLVLDRRRRMR
jgi:hypothetical protein